MEFNQIKLVVLDVDGTLTDGGIYYDSQGNEIKRFDVKDGLGIKVAQNAGIEFAILTGRVSLMVERRAKELGIKYIVSGVQKKYPAWRELLDKLGLTKEECGYIGDDWNDYQPMMECGFRGCPNDCPDEIKNISHFVSSKNGGHGAVRECLEFLLKDRNVWEETAKNSYDYLKEGENGQ